MRSTAGRALLGAALLIAAILLFVVLEDDGDGGAKSNGGADTTQKQPREGSTGENAKPPEPSIAIVEVENGKPVGGVEELEFDAGDRVRFEVESDVADEVHVHGYDVSKEVGAGGVVRFDFPATIEGLFEVELEERAEPIAELRVIP